MSNKIKDHAVDQYFIRIKDMDPRMVTNTEWKQAIEIINDAVENPDRIVHNKRDYPQVHIKGKLVIPVGVSSGRGTKLKPYTDKSEDLCVPTAYNVETFIGGRYDNTQKQNA